MNSFFLSGTGYQAGPSGGQPLPTLKTAGGPPPKRLTQLSPSIIAARDEMDMLSPDERWQVPNAFDAYGAERYLSDITEHVMNNPQYEGYNEQERNQIIQSFFKNKGPVMPKGIRSIDAGSAPRGEVPAKKVGPKDVVSNSKLPDYVAQRYAAMTPDQMNTAFLNDVIKRRMGYASGPMDEQLASWGKATGRDESQLVASMNRHYAGAQANKGPYAQVPKEQLNGRDQGMANAMRLLNAGLITPDQMPSMGLSADWNKKTKENKLGTAEGDYFAQSRRAGFFDSRDAAAARRLDADIAKPVTGPDWYFGTKEIPSMSVPDMVRELPDITGENEPGWESGRIYGHRASDGFRGLKTSAFEQPDFTDISPKPFHKMRIDPILGTPLSRKAETFDNNERSLLSTVPGAVRGTVGPLKFPTPQVNPSDPRFSGSPVMRQSPRSMITDYDFVGSDLVTPARRTISEVQGRQNAEDFLSTRALINKRFK